MADTLRYIAKAPIGLPAYQREEFSASPVDDVHRAIIQLDDVISWAWATTRATSYLVPLGLTSLTFSLMSPKRSSILSKLVDAEISSAVLRNRDLFTQELVGLIESEPANDFVADQFALKISGDFSPSKKLTDIWISSLSAMAGDVGKQIHVSADFEAAQEFSKTLYSLLGTIAQQLRYENPSDTSVTRNQRFTATYQILLCDAFLIIPDQAADFLGLLFSELSAAISAGCTMNGDWGELRVSPTQELYFRLSSPDFVVDPNFTESEKVE
jgi:hypothetical protein